ncbi:MAG: DNA cytosine methyltransferase, partial [Tomitella sp.]|nr:DNA cytosine methyltransferase [Tomitella sp.]
MLTATDLFAGAGGSSEGLEQAGYDVRIAANHWPLAVHTHQANHPGTEHRVANLAEVDWRTFPTTDLLWASPSCVWHSRSGGRRKPPAEVELIGEDEGSVDRATAFAVIAAAEVHRYPTVLVENVPEFRDWTLYRWWKEGLHALGYYTQELVLDAADLGHAQRRKRLFMAATLDPVTITPSAPDRVPASVILDADPGKPVTRRLYVADQLDQITRYVGG